MTMTLSLEQIFLIWVFGALSGMLLALFLMGPISIYNELREYRRNLSEESKDVLKGDKD